MSEANKFDRLIEEAKLGYAQNPDVKPRTHYFGGANCMYACAIGAAALHRKVDLDRMAPIGWAVETFGLTAKEAWAFTAGFDGHSKEEYEDYQEAYGAGVRARGMFRPIQS